KEFGEKIFLGAVRAAFKALHQTGAKDAGLYVADLPVKGRDIAWNVVQTIILAEESVYRFDQLKSKSEERQPSLAKVAVSLSDKSMAVAAETALQQGVAIARGMNVTKDLGDLAPNICTPSYLAERARDKAKTFKLKLSVLAEKELVQLGIGALL